MCSSFGDVHQFIGNCHIPIKFALRFLIYNLPLKFHEDFIFTITFLTYIKFNIFVLSICPDIHNLSILAPSPADLAKQERDRLRQQEQERRRREAEVMNSYYLFLS